MTVSFWDWVRAPPELLAARGIPREQVAAQRKATIGHARPITAKWLPAVGRWGGVNTLEEIAKAAGVSRADVKNYANAWGLKFKTRNHQTSHALLAAQLWLDRGSEPRESCRRFGVLPVERVMLCADLQGVLDDRGIEIRELLGFSVRKLDSLWADYNFCYTPPKPTLQESLEILNLKGAFAGEGAFLREGDPNDADFDPITKLRRPQPHSRSARAPSAAR